MALLEPGVSLSAPLAERLAPEYLFDASKEEHVATALETLKEEFITPPRPHYVFLATSLRSGLTTSSSARQIISQITGVDCVLGADLGGKGAQQKIIELIRRALFVMADVSDGNLNTLIEAGVALGAGTPLFLLAAGEPRPTRFMFRDFEVNFYRDELELYGALHREARKYRRNVLNRDLAGDNWF
jgi:hypothetical protein